jgi:hypothetical protein
MTGDFPGSAGAARTGPGLGGGAAAFTRTGSHCEAGFAQHPLEIFGAAFGTARFDLFLFLEHEDLEAFIAGQTPEFENRHETGLSLLDNADFLPAHRSQGYGRAQGKGYCLRINRQRSPITNY